MRTPGRGTSFKDVITNFLQQHDECSESQKEFLQRLRDDDANRIDDIWSRLVEKQPKLTDDGRLLFIEYLAEVWTVIQLARYEAVLKRLRHLMGVANARLKKYWAKRFVSASPHELPEILKEMESFSGWEHKRPDTPLSDFFPEMDIRSDHEGSRLRTAFMRFISNSTRALTGDWCDDEVATLTDIAFPRDESTTTDMVRSARRPARQP
jgi:hypothetical protein